MEKMKKYFYTFCLTIVIVVLSLSYMDNSQYITFNSKESILIKRSELVNYYNSEASEQDNNQNNQKNKNYNYLDKYPNILDCNVASRNIQPFEVDIYNQEPYDYSKPADNKTHDLRISRAVLVYFPIEKYHDFMLEFKWMYRSWIEMQKFEPEKWRTDLIVFIDTDKEIFREKHFLLSNLNCSLYHRRNSPTDRPICKLIKYKSMQERNAPKSAFTFASASQHYDHVLSKVDILNDDATNLSPFYSLLNNIKNYSYLDSILMAFDGYHYFKSAGYNFLIRSDMDVFLTPLFGQWLPRHCNDFYVGRGGFNTPFNEARLKRVAKGLNFGFASATNLGSTWYSTPDQFRVVSYLTLFSMTYLSQEEFSPTEREGKLGIQLWPYWHYGVLLLYGQSLAMNHLIETKQLNVVKLDKHVDYPSYYDEDVFKVIHIHVFHGSSMFSKFEFKAGKYNNLKYNKTSNVVKYYALRIAMDAKQSKSKQLVALLANVNKKKV